MIQTATNEVIVPEGAELIDDVFYVWTTRFGLYTTLTKQGRKMLHGSTTNGVITCPLSPSDTTNENET